MGDWIIDPSGSFWEQAGASEASTALTTITAAGAANTKGSFTELLSSSTYDITAIRLFVTSANNTQRSFLVDIAIGSAGNEQVIIPNVVHQLGGLGLSYGSFIFPVSIPRGSRISARCQSSTASAATTICLGVCYGNIQPSVLLPVETYGPDTADSTAASIDPGGSANTKGAYVQLTASTNRRLTSLLVASGNQNNAVRTACSWFIDIAVGSAGNEKVLIKNLYMAADVNELMLPESFGPFAVSIPAGTRIAARAQCSITDATDRLFDLAVYGV